jgi:hypothetical protein
MKANKISLMVNMDIIVIIAVFQMLNDEGINIGFLIVL